MSDLFPRVSVLQKGYDRRQVEEFFTNVRAAYERPTIDPGGMTPLDIRRAAFDLASRGYKTEDVDAALDRLEDAFAARLREQFVTANGQDAWNAKVVERAQSLRERLGRPAGERFNRPKGMGKGYDAKAVDELMDRIAEYFNGGQPVAPQDIRSASFARKAKFAAYDEAQVDAFLAKVVDIILGVA